MSAALHLSPRERSALTLSLAKGTGRVRDATREAPQRHRTEGALPERDRKSPLPPELLARCRELRASGTDAERQLWHLLRNRQLGGAKFRRQHCIGPYTADFYCREAGLVVELDGGQHAEPDGAVRDAVRDDYLRSRGLRVLRFWNHEVLESADSLLETIYWAVFGDSPHPGPLPEREGDETPLPRERSPA